MDRMPSTPARMILTVLITCMVSSSALAMTYGVTHERIEEQERLAREEALKEVLPWAETFEEVDEDVVECMDEAAGETPVISVFLADSDGADVDSATGYGFLVAPRGYGGPVNMVIGMDRDGKVTGVSIVTHNETPGLGTKIITEEGFLEQFEGWDGADVDEAAKDFDAISGATKSSVGVRKGVLAAGHAYEAMDDCVAAGQGEK